MSGLNVEPIKKASVFSIFGHYYGRKLIRLLDECCSGGGFVVNNSRFVGNNITTDFYIPAKSHLVFVSTDGRINDPLTEFTYEPSTGLISFVGAPSLDVIILSFFQ